MKNPGDTNRQDRFYNTAVRIAVVAAVFCVVVTALLVHNYVRNVVYNERRIEGIDRLKSQYRLQPDNQELIDRIRRIDLQARKIRVNRTVFAQRGRYLLAAGIAVFLAGTLSAMGLRKASPSPAPRGDVQQRQFRQASLSQRSVAAGALILGSAAVVLALLTGDGFQASTARSEKGRDAPVGKWPRFRGPGGLGISDFGDAPVRWSGDSGEGILWKSPVPLKGRNSPVVWGDRVYVTGATESRQQVYCFQAGSGRLLWTGDLEVHPPREPLNVMEDTGYAAPTAVTDGKRVCAIFADGNVACFAEDGRKLWSINIGAPDNPYGHATSLVMHQNLLLVQYDHGSAEAGTSSLLAIDKFTGRTRWKTPRGVSSSWCTPIIINAGGRMQLITCSDSSVTAYNPEDGAEIWKANCLRGEIAPSPIFAGGLVIAVEPYASVVAIKPDGSGEVTESHVAWRAHGAAPDICSPLGDGQFVYTLTTDGLLVCIDLKDGKRIWEHDLAEVFNASPSLAAGRIYLLSQAGTMFIISAGTEYMEIAKNSIPEKCHASPAFVDGRIYIRAERNLYCIGQSATE